MLLVALNSNDVPSSNSTFPLCGFVVGTNVSVFPNQIFAFLFVTNFNISFALSCFLILYPAIVFSSSSCDSDEEFSCSLCFLSSSSNFSIIFTIFSFLSMIFPCLSVILSPCISYLFLKFVSPSTFSTIGKPKLFLNHLILY